MRFNEILFQTNSEKLQLSILKNKKYFLSPCQYQNKKALFTDPIFSEGFGIYLIASTTSTHEKRKGDKKCKNKTFAQKCKLELDILFIKTNASLL